MIFKTEMGFVELMHIKTQGGAGKVLAQIKNKLLQFEAQAITAIYTSLPKALGVSL